MKRYENVKTGAIIDVSSVIHGEDWKEVKKIKRKPMKSSKEKKDDE